MHPPENDNLQLQETLPVEPAPSLSSEKEQYDYLEEGEPFPEFDDTETYHSEEYDIPVEDHVPRSIASGDLDLPDRKTLKVISPDSPALIPGNFGLGYRDSVGAQQLMAEASEKPSHPSHPTETDSLPSVFDQVILDGGDDEGENYTDPTESVHPAIANGGSGNEPMGSYDLKPPRPAALHSNIEYLAERLYSVDHLKIIVRDRTFCTRFRNFLSKYRPSSIQALSRYIDAQKALNSIEYANSLSQHISPGVNAAELDEDFVVNTREAVEELINDALPQFVTHRMVILGTDILNKTITGHNSIPHLQELATGLAEVYCLTDPSLPDNPIVYASEHFFRVSGYGSDFTLGRNCRFLQGPKTSAASVQRLVDALSEGREVCELVLNYRRDGSPFMNLLMIAPLFDNRGTARYFIGAQVDVNGLTEKGRGLDSFARLLAQDHANARFANGDKGAQDPRTALEELSSMFDDKDMEVVRKGRDSAQGSRSSTPTKAAPSGSTRRYVGMDDPYDQSLWPSANLGSSGRLPGVFQNYLLVRPYPSLRVTFTSPTLRIPGLLQSKFLDRIGGSSQVQEELLDALTSGVGVTAKVNWLPHGHNTHERYSTKNEASSPQSRGREMGPGSSSGETVGPDGRPGKERWIHCTPLFGSDGKVGVWMIVMVENEAITGRLNVAENRERELAAHRTALNGFDPLRMHPPSSNAGSVSASGGAKLSGQSTRDGNAFRGERLYQDYLRREGRLDSSILLPEEARGQQGYGYTNTNTTPKHSTVPKFSHPHAAKPLTNGTSNNASGRTSTSHPGAGGGAAYMSTPYPEPASSAGAQSIGMGIAVSTSSPPPQPHHQHNEKEQSRKKSWFGRASHRSSHQNLSEEEKRANLDAKNERSKMLAERAKMGEESFRDF